MASTIQSEMKTVTGVRPAWLADTSFPFQSRFLIIAGKRIHYIDEGSGPALLFVSAGQWAFMFRDVILRLRGQFRCLTLDFPGSGLSPDVEAYGQSVPANAAILDGFIDALDLQDITMVLHDVGGPIGFVVATERPQRIRALVISNTFGWPLADYPGIRRMLKVIANPVVGAINSLTNALAIVTASSYGVGRHMSKADRKAFLGPWRSRADRRATQQVLAGVLQIDPLMADIQHGLKARLGAVPVLTLFGRKNDPYGWQARFAETFSNVTEVGIEDAHHFPFNDDPDAYSRAISRWWAQKVVEADQRSNDESIVEVIK